MAQKQEKTVGEVIRDARAEKRKGLRELARALDITPSYLSDIENDRRVPAEDVLRRIVDTLSLDFDQLMALAGRFGDDVERYLKRHPTAGALLRQFREKDFGEDKLKELKKQADSMTEKNDQDENG